MNNPSIERIKIKVNEADLYADQPYNSRFPVSNDDSLNDFRCFNSVYPSSSGNQLIIFGYSGYEDNKNKPLDQDDLRYNDPQNQKIMRLTITDESPRYLTIKYILRSEQDAHKLATEDVYEDKRGQVSRLIGEQINEQEYVHHHVYFRGMHIMPTLQDCTLTYFDEKEGRYKPIPGIESSQHNDSDSD